ncbi:hypothetical protein BO86DRAFT_179425 [Aspergillus japonicus CBS 114.51]|uniref:Aminoglycoside phosphotransferase domain-containing protein n=2 Tax=Aspergillus TaxID=5052 RepID=A0A2V5HU69_ASPV1|nr:hypothetical protein BO86DRAFT_179425 [Aspergillus japonicus CBS 114.51]PYI19820.1 hypothetical protein BO99DRAFT_383635 [Aspergillus violaceofuscus CBS 115571]RAH78460.1 hypothetical protein BO86DRAFT_179425 [Aspergillus japonicus CBS 114.51]
MDAKPEDSFKLNITRELVHTRYACSSLTRLSGGTVNFVFRGLLSRPLEDGTKSVIIKHSEGYAAANRNLELTAERCLFEEASLKALNGLTSTVAMKGQSESRAITVKPPRLFTFHPETNTAVLEDLPDSLDLKTFCISSAASTTISQEWAVLIGRALGTWLWAFHRWTDEKDQAAVVAELEKNHAMRLLKLSVNYGSLAARIDQYPALLGEAREVFEQVRLAAAAEVEKKGEVEYGIIHGDFWSGNVLVPHSALDPSPQTSLFVVDWELCHFGPRAWDLGQMLAELYMLKHFRGIDAGPSMIEGFLGGYQVPNEAFAFWVLIHVGVHFITFGSMIRGWGTPEQVADLVHLGRDLIVKAWKKDREWFSGVWKHLF